MRNQFTRRLVFLLTLLISAFGCIGPASAPAAYIQSSVPTEEFQLLEEPFNQSGGAPNQLLFDQASKRLYVVRPNTYHCCNGFPPPQPPRGIWAYDMSIPGAPTLLGGNFPITLPAEGGGIVLDQTEGDLYRVNGGNGNGSGPPPEPGCEPPVGTIFKYDSEGNSLAGGFPAPFCVGHNDVDTDPLGYLWLSENSHRGGTPGEPPHDLRKRLYKYSPDGALLEAIDLDEFEPNSIAINPKTGDLWATGSFAFENTERPFSVVSLRFTAASGYTEYDLELNEGGGFGAFDGEHGVRYGDRSREIFSDPGLPAIGHRAWIVTYNEEGYPIASTPETPDVGYANSLGFINSIAFNEATGELYAIGGPSTANNEPILNGEKAAGGVIYVFHGAIIPDLETTPPSSGAVGHTGAVVTGHVDPAGGPGVGQCEFQYLRESEFNEIQTVTVTGATGGTFTVQPPNGPTSKALPFNATAAEVQEALEEPNLNIREGNVLVTGPAGGPYTVEFVHFLRNFNFRELTANDSLTPGSAKVEVATVHDGGIPAWSSATSVPCEPPASSGSPIEASTDVDAELSGLETGVPYRYRLVAGNSNGTNYGLAETVIPQPSLVKTGEANPVDRHAATLNGTVDPEGVASTYYFEWGKGKSYGEAVPSPPGGAVGTLEAGDQPVSSPIEGLDAGTTYHYRLVEVNSKGTSYGVDRTFTTETAVKGLATDSAESISRTGATLKGSLDADGLETHYYFEYGKTARYGSQTAVPPGDELADTSPGAQQLSALIEGLKPATTYHFRFVAENSEGATYGHDRTFTTLSAVVGLETETASEVEPTAATLRGHLDPDGYDTTYYFEYGKTKAYGHTITAPPGDDVGTSEPGSLELEKTLTALEPGTTYHFRIVGVNEIGSTVGADETFETPQGPSIEGVYSSEVSAHSAALRARINPNGTDPSFETSYRFEYGTTTGYGEEAPASAPGSIAPASGGQNVSVPVSSLSPVTYHFRLIAENAWGKVTSEDQTFEFNPPSTCPNATVRQLTRAAYLPDCRAYELVSPAQAGGALLSPLGPASPTVNGRFAFTGAVNTIPGAGDPPNVGSDLYVATRTPGGWSTRYVGLSATEAIGQLGLPTATGRATGNGNVLSDRDLSQFVTWRGTLPSVALRAYSFAPYRWDATGNSLGRLPTNLAQVAGGETPLAEGGFEGDAKLTSDGKHYVFSALGTAFTEDGLTGEPGSVYDDELATGAVTKVSYTAAGANIEQDAAVAPVSEYLRIPAVSSDGSHILMSTVALGNTTHLYMRVNDALTYDVSVGEDTIDHGVHFDGMADGGKVVYFTTAAQMTADDHDESVDLYRWDEAEGSPTLTRISAGDEGSYGDRDGCKPDSGWATGCGVEVVPTFEVRGPFTVTHPLDSSIAEQSGDVYFYSPEELEGSRGVPNKRNLYVYHEGQVHHVATLEPNAAVKRIDVAADGGRAAFVTATRIGAYDNAGHAEMYRYDPEARTLVCVSCKPDGSPPTSDVEASQNGLFMTTDGRVFFTTEDALSPRDADGIPDVYEYTGGRAQLLTTGTGNDDGKAAATPIGLVSVSADGTDAFVSTFETLIAQDENGPFLKFYDARSGGGFPYNKPPAPCAAADECHGPSSTTPATPQVGSGTYLGKGGNFAEHKKKAKKHHKRHRTRHKQHRHAQRKGAGR